MTSGKNNNTATKLRDAVLVAIIVCGAIGAILMISSVQNIVFPKATVTVDRGYYYRVLAKYEYLGTPVDFNIVVGCSVEITDSKLTGKSYMTGIAPAVYGLKMPNGKGLVMRVPEACNGTKTWDLEKGPYPEGKLAFILSPTFRPFMAVYDNADKPMFGWGYASDDAYDSPLSELKFLSVRIDQASREEFAAWRTADAKKNIITTDIISWDPVTHKNFANVKPGHWIFGDHCRGVRRHKMPPLLTEALRPMWPTHRPDYWLTYGAARVVFERNYIIGSDGRTGTGPYDGVSIGRYPITLKGFSGEHGMLRTGGGHFFVTAMHPALAGEIYPVRSNFTINTLHLQSWNSATHYTETVLLDAQHKGFVFCDGPDGNVAGNQNSPRQRWRVNDVDVFDVQESQGDPRGSLNDRFFYRAEEFFQPIGVGFHATMGSM